MITKASDLYNLRKNKVNKTSLDLKLRKPPRKDENKKEEIFAAKPRLIKPEALTSLESDLLPLNAFIVKSVSTKAHSNNIDLLN